MVLVDAVGDHVRESGRTGRQGAERTDVMQARRDDLLGTILRAEVGPPGRETLRRGVVATLVATAVAYLVATWLDAHDLVTGEPWALALVLPIPGIVSGGPFQRALGGGTSIENRPTLRLVVGVASMAAVLWTAGWPCVLPASAALVGVVHVHRSGSRAWPAAVAVTVAYTAVGEVLSAAGLLDVVIGTTEDLAPTLWSLAMACLVIGNAGVSVARRERAEQALARAEAQLRTLVESSPDIIDVLDDQGTILFTSTAVRSLGYTPDDVVGRSVLEFVDDAHRPAVAEALEQVRAAGHDARAAVDTLVRHADGSYRWYQWRLHNLHEDPKVQGVVLQQRDVHEHVLRSSLLEHAASHDPLTGLANRTELRRVLAGALRRCGPGAGVALLFIDLDGFKAINDTYGHGAGDRVLVAVADRLRLGTRRHDHLARIGGDEFCAVLTEVRTPDEVDVVVRRIHDELARPVDVGGAALPVAASVGAVITTDPQHDPDRLLEEADAAMYEVKRSGGRGALGRTGPAPRRSPAGPDRAAQ